MKPGVGPLVLATSNAMQYSLLYCNIVTRQKCLFHYSHILQAPQKVVAFA